MRASLINKLCCPIDKGELDIRIFVQREGEEEHEETEILEALFTCRECNRYYPVIYGIPIMTPDEYRDKSLEEPVMRRWGLDLPESAERFQLPGKRTDEE